MALYFYVILLRRMSDTGGSSQKYPGITSPISLAEPKPHDLELSKKVEEAMRPYGTFERDQELAKRYTQMHVFWC